MPGGQISGVRPLTVNVEVDCLEEPQALRQQPQQPVQGRVHSRTDSGFITLLHIFFWRIKIHFLVKIYSFFNLDNL